MKIRILGMMIGMAAFGQLAKADFFGPHYKCANKSGLGGSMTVDLDHPTRVSNMSIRVDSPPAIGDIQSAVFYGNEVSSDASDNSKVTVYNFFREPEMLLTITTQPAFCGRGGCGPDQDNGPLEIKAKLEMAGGDTSFFTCDEI